MSLTGPMAVVTFVVLFPLLWMAVLQVIAISGGWRSLGESYATDRPFVGTLYRWQYGRIGWAAYEGCLWIGVSADGLYLATGPGPIFKAGHLDLLLPWRAVAKVRYQTSFFRRCAVLTVDDPKVSISIPSDIVRKAAAAGYLPPTIELIGDCVVDRAEQVTGRP